MPSFTAKSRWGDQTQQGGGGSGADKVEAAFRKAMASQGQEGLVPDNPFIAHTRQVWVADGYVPETYYTLSPEAAELLRPVFGSWGFDPSQDEFNFGWTPKGTAAYTVGNQVHINSDWWGEQTGLDR